MNYQQSQDLLVLINMWVTTAVAYSNQLTNFQYGGSTSAARATSAAKTAVIQYLAELSKDSYPTPEDSMVTTGDIIDFLYGIQCFVKACEAPPHTAEYDSLMHEYTKRTRRLVRKSEKTQLMLDVAFDVWDALGQPHIDPPGDAP